MNTIRSVCVYCGSSPGRGELYLKAGHVLGRAIAEAGLRLVYGGGTRGVMGAVAALDRLHELIVTDDMHQRKHTMFDKSDAFVALPGGIGTVEEIIEIMTWAQLGHHRKPMVFGNISGFWNPMMALIDHMKAEGFIHTSHLVNPLVIDTAEAIVPAILIAASSDNAPTEGVPSVIEKM